MNWKVVKKFIQKQELVSPLHETLCVIWHHLYNLKNVKKNYGGMLILVKLQALASNFNKSNTHPTYVRAAL